VLLLLQALLALLVPQELLVPLALR